MLRTATFAMATRFELVLERDDARALAAAEAALAVIEACDARWSRFRPDSIVSRVNCEAGAAWVRVDQETFELLERCLAWRSATYGAFDLCVGAPMDRVRASRACSCAELTAGAFELDARASSVRFTRPGTQLDLGAIGKGAALDLAGAVLREAGIDVAFLHGGTSSALALGAPESPDGWRVGLGPEFDDATILLRDKALSVSATRGSRSSGSTRAAKQHILDPRDGAVLASDSRCAVTAPSAGDAEAWSTALLVLAAREINDPAQFDCAAIPAAVDWTFSEPRSRRLLPGMLSARRVPECAR